ncbi:MAG TPA: hypothetical protein VF453_12040 [Burkholderiaceae bacterium]
MSWADGEIDGLDLVGTTFTFAYGGCKADQFYVSDLAVRTVPQAAVAAPMLSSLELFLMLRRGGRSL